MNKNAFYIYGTQLSTISENEVVKVAGIARRIKNWILEKLDPKFKESLNELRVETAGQKLILERLYDVINNLQEAIKNGDLKDYKKNFEQFKKLTSELLLNSKEIISSSKDYFLRVEMEHPEFPKKFQEAIQPEIKLEIGKKYNEPLKNFDWYKNTSSDIIFVNAKGTTESTGSFGILLNQIIKILDEKYGQDPKTTKDILLKNVNEISENFKKAILDGTLLEVFPKEPSAKIIRVPLGRISLNIKTAPFNIPVLDKKIQVLVKIMDARVGRDPKNKIVVEGIRSVDVVASFNFIEFLKKAERVAYKITPLSDVEFAKIMKQAYKNVFGKDPTLQILAGGWAQAVLESGRPIKLPNNNIGNVKAGKQWINSGKPFFSKKTGEFTKDGKYYQTDANWKAFASPIEGAEYYWKYLKEHHPEAVQYMAAQDPESAAVSLGLKGYYTARIDKYASGTASLYHEFMQKIAHNFPELKNEILQGKEKLPIKQFAKDYDHKSLNRNTENDNSIDNLIKDLVAFPLTNLVKKAIVKRSLPITYTLSIINGNSEDSVKFAKELNYLLTKHLDSQVYILKSNQNIEINAKTAGSVMTVTNAVQALCDMLSDSFKYKLNNNIQIITAPNVISTYNNKEII